MPTETRRVAGRYEVRRLLGSGGMASVHLAWQPALNREVALKELHSIHVADAALARRFLQESRVAGGLSHPSIVSVIEYFEHDGVPFIAMEYLERGSLRPLVGRLTLAQVAGVLESVLSGLAEAASHGIVHRDLKPENVLITADGHAKVADFGIAKAIGQLALTDFHTATGQVIGTPAYMAPEQAMGGEITPQADLYAVGLIAYELLAGRHPFHDCDAPLALLMRHVGGAPPELGGARPDLPDGVLAWVGAMLAKDPAARPTGAARAWDDLDGVLCEALGARWRKAAALPGPLAVAPPVEAAASPDTGFESTLIHPVLPPRTPPTARLQAPVPTAPVAPDETPTAVLHAVRPRRARAHMVAPVALILPLVIAALVLALVARHGPGAAPASPPAPVAHNVKAHSAVHKPRPHARRSAAVSKTGTTTARATSTPSPSRTPAPTPTPIATATPTPSATPSATPTPAATAAPTPVASGTTSPPAVHRLPPLRFRKAIRRAILLGARAQRTASSLPTAVAVATPR